MSSPPASAVRTRPGRPQIRFTRTLGILTLIYTLFMLAYGCLSALLLVGLPKVGDLMDEVQAQTQGSVSARRASAIQELSDREAKAATPEEVAAAKIDRVVFEGRRQTGMPMSNGVFQAFSSPAVQRPMWIQTGCMALLNLMILVGAFGLMRVKEWARVASRWMSALKVPALAAFTVLSVLYVAPPMAESWTNGMREMLSNMGGFDKDAVAQGNWSDYGAVMHRTFSIVFVLYNVFGMAFPIVLFLMLGSRRVREECSGKPVA